MIASKILNSAIVMKVQCGHCNVINYITDASNQNDQTVPDVDGVLCWKCGQESPFADDTGLPYDWIDQGYMAEDGKPELDLEL